MRPRAYGRWTIRNFILAATIAAVAAPIALPSAAVAQSRVDQQRWDAAQARYRAETDRYYAERDRWTQLTQRGGYRGSGYGQNGYGREGYGANYAGDDRYDPNYDASRYYRDGQYQERVLSADERVYAGNDGRYYCKRPDGTTGLIVGGAAGGVLGNVIDGGHSRTAGTLLGAAIGALAGRAVDQNSSNQQIRCR